jgi:hypothetical protein
MDERLKAAIRDLASEALVILINIGSESAAITAVKDELKFFIQYPDECSPNILAHAKELVESN